MTLYFVRNKFLQQIRKKSNKINQISSKLSFKVGFYTKYDKIRMNMVKQERQLNK
jgi:hypothetical protein